ncbi:hypothetical protein HOLleu_06882 [Holothuria leucospilota]|uniref:Integrase catalytic domain-containing protein n=1 Tax=Holothuria leucospilota TaxID=206669 RepID=A0A9Q1HJY0_HOLLE|nr:hypothetical protein HOLleu_06882 [Holothuria leucospilota]
MLQLQGYKYTIKYVPGQNVPIADCLSRCIATDCKTTQIPNIDVHVHEITNMKPFVIDRIRAATASDTILQTLKTYIIEFWPSEKNQCNEISHAYWQHRHELAIYNGLILKGSRIIIPTSMRPKILSILHQQHQGIEKTRLRARQSVFWPGLNAEIERMIQECVACQTHQKNQSKLPVKPIHSTRAMETIGVDLFEYKNKQYLLAVDYFTGFVWADYLPNTRSDTVVVKLDSIFTDFVRPTKLISDNGPQLTSQVMQEFCEKHEVIHETSAPHHQQANGRAERNIQTIKNMLKKTDSEDTKSFTQRNFIIVKGHTHLYRYSIPIYSYVQKENQNSFTCCSFFHRRGRKYCENQGTPYCFLCHSSAGTTPHSP